MPLAKTKARGYGERHKRERKRIQNLINRGEVFQCTCTRTDCIRHIGRCPTRIVAGMPWDLGHTDDRTGYNGVECVACNRGAGGRSGAAKVNGSATKTNATIIHLDW